ncbi:MAG: hypothetical protein ACRDOU_25350 [Streptosporangiaceae bacterium]
MTDDNPRAELYLRLGFGETGCRLSRPAGDRDQAGERQAFSDPGRFLVKDLRAAG